MATAAFRSTTRRSSAADHRRSRSLSRYSGRFPPPTPQPDDHPTPRGKFVNKVRGSGDYYFDDVNLDDLADEFFRARYEESEEELGGGAGRRLSRRVSDAGGGSAAVRRGRSVSRPVADKKEGSSSGGGRLRRRRSLSVARPQCNNFDEKGMDFVHNSSSQARMKSHCNGNLQQPSFSRPTTSSLLRKSSSQKDLLQPIDNSSSHSSLTDDDTRDDSLYRSGNEKTIRAVYTQNKVEHATEYANGPGFYEAMRKEVRHAVAEIKTELEKVVKDSVSIVGNEADQLKSSNSIQAITDIRKSYSNQLVQSEKRRQDLLAELEVEEQRGEELSMIVREFLPAPKHNSSSQTSSRSTRRSNDENRMSKRLTEEAEKYIEDFLSNVEDTDISSFDGERSETSSTLGGPIKSRDPIMHNIPETHEYLVKAVSQPAETDGVVLPWLEWETTTDASPLPSKSRETVHPENNLLSPHKETNCATSNNVNYTSSSRGSWSPEATNSYSAASAGNWNNRISHSETRLSISSIRKSKNSSFDMDEYEYLQHNENIVFEMWKLRHRIESGGLHLCTRTCI